MQTSSSLNMLSLQLMGSMINSIIIGHGGPLAGATKPGSVPKPESVPTGDSKLSIFPAQDGAKLDFGNGGSNDPCLNPSTMNTCACDLYAKQHPEECGIGKECKEGEKHIDIKF